jgi:YbgC/YbaW family acyl-CoA thioester hydrolase
VRPAFTWVHHVRYIEVDIQRVVYNAHYLAWCDDAANEWFASMPVPMADLGWDAMVKKATIEWNGSSSLMDDVTIEARVERWGHTSFDLGFRGRVGERPVFTATITYVGVVAGTTETMPPPPEVRAALGEP